MTTIDSDYSSLDTNEGIAVEDRFSLSKMPFSDWIVIKLATSDLYPQNYKLRAVEEKGSISETLSSAKINLFDRIPEERNWLFKTVKSVALFAIATFITPLFAIGGTLYHGTLTIKHLVIQLFCSKNNAVDNWKKVLQHTKGLKKDLLITVLTIALIQIVFFPDPWRPYSHYQDNHHPGLIVLCGVVPGISLFSTSFLVGLFGSSLENLKQNDSTQNNFKDVLLEILNTESFYKSIILMREFGITNLKGEFLKNWDWKNDNALNFDNSNTNFKYSLSGYFGNLLISQGREFLDMIIDLQDRLPLDCKFSFSYPPTSAKVADFLDKNKSVIGLSESEIAEWKQKFSTLSSNMNLISDLISHGFRKNPSHFMYMGFPLTNEECQLYLSKPDLSELDLSKLEEEK